MLFIFIGLIVGCSLVLTGSGGALLAIPLFMTFLASSLKDATLYSLCVVMIASFLGMIKNYKFIDLKSSLLISATSLLSSYLVKGYKHQIDDGYIKALLALVSLLSLFFMWKKIKEEKHSRPKNQIGMLLLSGLILGALTTFTGLGGGVLLLPLFLHFFGFSEVQAIATSLMTVFFSSSLSFFLQYFESEMVIKTDQIFLMTIGVVTSYFFIGFLAKFLNPGKMSIIRRLVYTAIVIYTLTSLYLRGHA